MDSSSSELWNIPAAQPPPGKQPNFVNPPSQAPVLATGVYVLGPLLLVFFTFRIYTRAHLTRALGVDDLLCAVAFASVLAYGGVLLAILNLDPFSPLGRHMWDIPVAAFSNEYSELVIMALTTSSTAAMLVKFTILAFYYRLFRPVQLARWLIWTGIATIAAFYLVTIIVLLANCIPHHSETWQSRVNVGTCPVVQVRIALAQGVFGLVSDLYILAIPVWQVSGLSLPPKRKAGLLVVFLTGLMAIASSAGGLATREQVTLADPNYLTTPYLFGLCEVTIGLICSCMPVITVPLKSLVTRTLSSWHSIKRYSHTLLSRKDNHAPSASEDGLPPIPKGALSGVRTFIRKLGRSGVRSVSMSEPASFGTLSSETDQDYHGQLREIQCVEIEGSNKEAAGSRHGGM
ncbi:hypothetical protein F4780DRAFT_724348 [Xylariomycetidae sp. FL0641]|nr:hypothetical protein F4780DRAFT_724348 [Xylariomycetidae sp. FL0641]